MFNFIILYANKRFHSFFFCIIAILFIKSIVYKLITIHDEKKQKRKRNIYYKKLCGGWHSTELKKRIRTKVGGRYLYEGWMGIGIFSIIRNDVV